MLLGVVPRPVHRPGYAPPAYPPRLGPVRDLRPRIRGTFEASLFRTGIPRATWPPWSSSAVPPRRLSLPVVGITVTAPEPADRGRVLAAAAPPAIFGTSAGVRRPWMSPGSTLRRPVLLVVIRRRRAPAEETAGDDRGACGRDQRRRRGSGTRRKTPTRRDARRGHAAVTGRRATQVRLRSRAGQGTC